MSKPLKSQVREFALSVIVRPLLFVFWSLVLWGTFYGAALLYAVVREGPTAAVARALGGNDALAARANLALVGLAVLVWTAVALVVRAHRARRRSSAPDIQDQT